MNKSKKYMIISICILCITILGSTVAYYTKVLFETNVNTITYGLDYYINYNKGTSITSATLNASDTYTGGNSADIELWKKDNTYDIYGHIYLDIATIGPNLASSDALKYTVVNGAEVIASGSLKNSEPGSSILLKANIPLKTTKEIYTVYIWLDSNSTLSVDMESESLSVTIRCEATMKRIGDSLVSHITNLYNNASKTEVNAADGITYNYATSVGLMNDRFGNSTIGINDGNIRYYGATPYNYIDIGDHYEQDVVKGNWEKFVEEGMFSNSSECYTFFGDENLINMGACTDATTCETFRTNLLAENGLSSVDDICGTTTIPKGTPIMYRIIGLFKNVELADGTKKDLIKVIRNEPIGNYSWDQSDSTANSEVNEWSQADLMKLLNPTYESESIGGSLYWNSGSGICHGFYDGIYTLRCDFTNTGLSTSAQNNIEAVKWNLGGWNTREVFANQMYYYERQGNVVQNPSDGIQRKTVWEGRVALPYPSDYGYAVDLSSCSSNLYYYEDCTGDNWMYNSMTSNGYSYSWLLTPNSSLANNAWHVNSGGGVYYGGSVYDGVGVSPVFYLDSELTVESGTGRSYDPYILW